MTDDIEVEDLLYDYQEEPVYKNDTQENKDNIQKENIINLEINDINNINDLNENETPHENEKVNEPIDDNNNDNDKKYEKEKNEKKK